MMIVGLLLFGVIFLGVGWAVSTEMFQHRAWRKRVESGDTDIVAALIEEALATWRRGRPPRGTTASLWAGIQAAQLVSVETDGVTLSTSAEGDFRTEGGTRVQVASALDEGIAVAARLLDMIMYDVPNLRLGYTRVDVYSTFTGADGTPSQLPILTVTAERATADDMTWEALTPEEILGRFDATYSRSPNGQPLPIELPELVGNPPRPTDQAAADFAASLDGGID
jgi:hypothetical protein